VNSGYSILPIATRIFKLGENIFDFIYEYIEPLENDVIVITSKIVSLAENRTIPLDEVDKTSLVQKESDIYIGEMGYGCHLTVKHGLLIPSAGIDESNADGSHYILFPEDPFKSAEEIWKAIKQRWSLENLGIIISDSHTSPLRRGVTGIALSHWGMRGVKNMIGKQDLFGRQLKMTQINVADALATAAVFAMGEANEGIPLAIVRGSDVEFVANTDKNECKIPIEEDLYAPLLKFQ